MVHHKHGVQWVNAGNKIEQVQERASPTTMICTPRTEATNPLWTKLKVLRVLTSVSGHARAAALGRAGRPAVAAFPAAAPAILGFSEEVRMRPADSVSTPVTVQKDLLCAQG